MSVAIAEIAEGVLRCVSRENVVFFVVVDSDRPPAARGRPANGGIRIQEYPDEAAAIREAHSLAERMTHKQALYNTGFGGVKIVVCASPAGLDKRTLMDAIAQVLHTLQGSVYTGCDLNTDDQDMRYLAQQSPYVLAGIGSDIDPSEATASGVYGTILGAVGTDEIRHKRFLVHGIGKVGLAIAQRLTACGAGILSYDMVPERANHPGFYNVSDCSEWWRLPFDVLVLCSASNMVTPAIARQLPCQAVVGSANQPFDDTKAVAAILEERNILWIPDIVSSAGDVISDSIEHYAPDVFRHAEPAAIYAFISHLTCGKTQHLLEKYRRGTAMSEVLTSQIYREHVGSVCGLTFQLTQPFSVQPPQYAQEEYTHV
ncbi:Glu/Leu/Phe/Val dehydrogenase dimerization domain-containing protein [Candidatus Entotheonella palauensis]|uniref:Glu/Leu/Phe/Val dehydrogenase dimerization domain-containing protein n=1 Tax=Candidatus Entotheonella palauensis TaxID=93172 RepID=UPI000B7F855D|nr:Glu/Leu/Phe/Val dehydrogenase dimerization domain-containing protein [Candidatus Entotheonella palauensis]